MPNTIIGSGSIPFTTIIRQGEILGDGSAAEGYRSGANVIITNPEEYTSSPFFAVSGITIGAGLVEELPTIFARYGDKGVHRRTIDIYNVGPGLAMVSHDPNVITETSYPIPTGQNKEFGLMDNVQIFVQASGMETDVRWFEK